MSVFNNGGLAIKYHAVAKRLSDRSKPYYILNFLAELIIGFFMASAVCMRMQDIAYTDNGAYVAEQSLAFFAMLVLAIAGMLFAATLFVTAERVLPAALVVSLLSFFLCLPKGGDRNIWLGVGMTLIALIACLWIFNRFPTAFSEFRMGFPVARIVVGVCFLVFVVYMSAMSVARYYSFTYNTFDFGIFMQMFTYMKETGLPFTTVERNMQLSHFAVHFSPFFYILLPGYMLFSSPVYLCIMQVLFVGLGVFAVFGIARTLGFSPKMTLLISVLYLVYPSVSYGLYFDFHENKFLAFCILYAVYFLLKRKFIPFYIFALLLCSVKEDAAIYLVAIALFMLLHERLIRHGLITLVMALGYFVFALFMIQQCGATESMEFGYRYSNFELNGEAGIGGIIMSTLLNLGYTIGQIFQEDKFEYLLWMFVPVLFSPFMTKKVSTLVLLAPMLLVNFMSNWIYQYDVDFQYTYGTAAMIVVCSILALIGMRPRARKVIVVTALIACISMTVPRVIARNSGYIKGYLAHREMFHNSIAFLDENLDKNAVIGVEGDIMPILYDCPYMYLDPHDDEKAAKIQYFVTKEEDSNIGEMVDRGFELVAEDGYVQIYVNPHYEGDGTFQ